MHRRESLPLGMSRWVAADRLLLGEPNGEVTDRVQAVVSGLRSGGVNAENIAAYSP